MATIRNIRHELLIEVPSEKVYGAITTQEGLAGWWTPDAKAKPERDSVARFPFGPDYFKEMKVAECNYTWGQFLRSLKLFCETGKGRSWPNQHRVKS